MYSVSETIDNGKVLVSAHAGIWIKEHILYWPPPDQQVDRSLLTVPGPDWIPHMCRVLKENIGKLRKQIFNLHVIRNLLREKKGILPSIVLV